MQTSSADALVEYIKTSRLHFLPKPDITAYELALLLELIVPHTVDAERIFTAMSEWPEAIFRHIENGDQLRTKFQELKSNDQ